MAATSSDFKVKVEKLEGPDDWPKWKWQVLMVLRANCLESLIDGSRKCPVLSTDAQSQEKKELTEWLQDDARAASLIACALSKSVAELVLTCTKARDIWDKLCARFERSSTQRLNMLIESFFQAQRDYKEDISAHVAKLQKLFVDLNDELVKHSENTLSERMLTGRILSTLGKEYHNFKDVWDTIPAREQTVNLLIEKLCAIELRADKLASSEATAFAARESDKEKSSSMKVNTGKLMKKGTNRAKQKFPCNKCKQLGHWAAECPQKQQHLRDKGSKSATKKSSDTLLLHVMGASEVTCMNSDSWYCDSGASRHITPSRQYFVSYAKFSVPKIIQLGKKHVIMKAYGEGTIKVQLFHNGISHDAILKDVWYVPDASAHLFSVKAAAKNGYSTTFSENKVVIHGTDGTVAVSGKLSNDLYVLDVRVCIPQDAAQIHLATKTETLQVWHERLGHQNKRHVVKMLKQHGMNVEASAEFCDGCALGKAHRRSFGTRTTRPNVVGEQINADVCGPMTETSAGGARYYVCFKDDYSKYRRVFFIATKNEVVDCLRKVLKEVRTAGHVTKVLLSDGGKEFNCKAVQKVLEEYGITHRIAMPYTPEQNGAAEQENRTIVESARSMLHASGLPKELWAEACNTAVYILNRTGPTPVEGKTPLELWTGRSCETLSQLRVFGTECYVHTPKQKRHKWDPKSELGRLVGYVGETDGYRIWMPKERKIALSRDVLFKPEVTCSSCSDIIQNESTCPTPHVAPAADLQISQIYEDNDGNSMSMSGGSNESNQETDVPDCKSKRERKQPEWMTSGEFVCLVDGGQGNYSLNPISYAEAMLSNEKKQWLKAMHEELESLKENETWELVTRPINAKVIQNRWVMRVKMSSDGSAHFKARLVAKGYVQKQGIDYDETFSPVARYDTVRTLLAVAASNNMKLKQFDVKTAFLYGELEEEVYLEQPEGFDDGSGRVCRLKRSLYGLKQAPRCWNKRLITFMKKAGLKNSTADPCLFYRTNKGSSLYVAIYVDDGLIVGNKDEEIEGFLKLLQEEFKITSGSLENFLGMQIKCESDGSIFLSQEAYTNKILKRFNMADANGVSTPASREESDNMKDVSGKVPYREAVGSLMYLMVATRPDIAFAVNKAARVMDKPAEKDWNDVKRIFRYLRATSNYGLKYTRGSSELKVFSDADFAGDKATRCSTMGIVAMFSGGAVSWTSQLQKTTALSTTEAEIIAASEGAKELVWLKRLLSELLSDFSSKIPTLYIDNAGAIKLAKNPEYHKRSKHIEVRHFYVRERYLKGDITIEHIDGRKQLADLLTKPIERVRFEMLCREIGIISRNQ